MAKPTKVCCPICERGVKWFYGTKRFAWHHDHNGKPCRAINLIGNQKGAAPFAPGNTLHWIVPEGGFEPFATEVSKGGA